MMIKFNSSGKCGRVIPPERRSPAGRARRRPAVRLWGPRRFENHLSSLCTGVNSYCMDETISNSENSFFRYSVTRDLTFDVSDAGSMPGDVVKFLRVQAENFYSEEPMCKYCNGLCICVAASSRSENLHLLGSDDLKFSFENGELEADGFESLDNTLSPPLDLSTSRDDGIHVKGLSQYIRDIERVDTGDGFVSRAEMLLDERIGLGRALGAELIAASVGITDVDLVPIQIAPSTVSDAHNVLPLPIAPATVVKPQPVVAPLLGDANDDARPLRIFGGIFRPLQDAGLDPEDNITLSGNASPNLTLLDSREQAPTVSICLSPSSSESPLSESTSNCSFSASPIASSTTPGSPIASPTASSISVPRVRAHELSGLSLVSSPGVAHPRARRAVEEEARGDRGRKIALLHGNGTLLASTRMLTAAAASRELMALSRSPYSGRIGATADDSPVHSALGFVSSLRGSDEAEGGVDLLLPAPLDSRSGLSALEEIALPYRFSHSRAAHSARPGRRGSLSPTQLVGATVQQNAARLRPLGQLAYSELLKSFEGAHGGGGGGDAFLSPGVAARPLAPESRDLRESVHVPVSVAAAVRKHGVIADPPRVVGMEGGDSVEGKRRVRFRPDPQVIQMATVLPPESPVSWSSSSPISVGDCSPVRRDAVSGGAQDQEQAVEREGEDVDDVWAPVHVPRPLRLAHPLTPVPPPRPQRPILSAVAVNPVPTVAFPYAREGRRTNTVKNSARVDCSGPAPVKPERRCRTEAAHRCYPAMSKRRGRTGAEESAATRDGAIFEEFKQQRSVRRRVPPSNADLRVEWLLKENMRRSKTSNEPKVNAATSTDHRRLGRSGSRIMSPGVTTLVSAAVANMAERGRSTALPLAGLSCSMPVKLKTHLENKDRLTREHVRDPLMRSRSQSGTIANPVVFVKGGVRLMTTDELKEEIDEITEALSGTVVRRKVTQLNRQI